jgi:integrase
MLVQNPGGKMGRYPRPWLRKGRGWCVVIDGKRIRLGPDKQKAFEAFHRLMLERGRQSPPQLISCHEVFDLYLEQVSRKNSPFTYRFYRSFVIPFLDIVGRQRPAESLDAQDMDAVLDRMADTSRTNRAHMVATIKGALRWATNTSLISSNPLEGVRPPRRGIGKTRALSDQEVARILGSLVRQPRFRQIVITLLLTGCRVTELRRVKTENVFLEGIPCWSWRAGTAPKGKKARTVILGGEALEITKALVRQSEPEEHVFRNHRGEALTTNAIRIAFWRLGRKAGIPALRATDFRHTFATRALRAGIPPAHVSALLGHSDLSMLSRTYGHLGEDRSDLLDASRRALEAISPSSAFPDTEGRTGFPGDPGGISGPQAKSPPPGPSTSSPSPRGRRGRPAS